MKTTSGNRAKYLFLCGCMILAMFALAAPALADTVTGGGSWQTWSATNVNENGAPYWDHSSFDGSQYNVGYYLLNSGAFAGCATNCGPGSATNLPFWGGTYNSAGDSGGASDLNFYFNKTDPGQSATFKIKITGNINNNEIGWFETDGTTVGVKHTLFTGTQGPGASATFTPTAKYGYYLISGTEISPGVHETFYTLSGQDNISSAIAANHFAVFKQGDPSYWIGIEDLVTHCATNNAQCINDTATNDLGSDFDYNDAVFEVTPVPEPASIMLLLGSGLVGVGIALRRRFFRS